MKKTRVEWLDNAKGIGIILVVVGHSIITPIRDGNYLMNLIYSCIYYFHMPFMMFLSGMSFGLFQKKDASCIRQIKKKFRQLIVPYISYSILVVTVIWVLIKIPMIGEYMANAGYALKPIYNILLEMVIGGNTYAIHLWYLYALFIFYTFRILTEKWLNEYHQVLIGAILFAVKCIVNTDNLYIINSICTLYFWFALGGCLKINKQAFEMACRQSWRKVVAVLVSFSYVVCDILFIPTPHNPLLYTLHTIFKFMIIYILFVGIIAICMDQKKEKWKISKLGEKSFSIYLFHQPFICLCGVTVLNMFLPDIVAVIIGVYLSIFVPYMIIDKILELKYMKGLRIILKGR